MGQDWRFGVCRLHPNLTRDTRADDFNPHEHIGGIYHCPIEIHSAVMGELVSEVSSTRNTPSKRPALLLDITLIHRTNRHLISDKFSNDCHEVAFCSYLSSQTLYEVPGIDTVTRIREEWRASRVAISPTDKWMCELILYSNLN